jgi:hypothetical protein
MERRHFELERGYLNIDADGLYLSHGAVYGVNCVFDRSEPAVFPTEVIGRSEHRGRKGSRSYYVHVAPWGHHRDTESIRVSASEYAAVQEGDSVDIDLKKGLLGIPWYYMVRHPDGGGTNTRW